jgi:hypothetical protein
LPYTAAAVRSHDWIDRRSLALHAAVADKLELDAAVIDHARRNVERWLRVRRTPAIVEWQALLRELPVPEIVRLLRATDQNAARLRQSSPFAGVLAPEERRAILRAYDADRA